MIKGKAAYYYATFCIKYNDETMAKWDTQDYDVYYTNHADLLAQIENEAIEKGAKVLKIK